MREEVAFAVEAAQNGNWKLAWEVAKGHSRWIIVGGVVVLLPIVVLVRFPPLIGVLLRLGAAGSMAAMRIVLYNPKQSAVLAAFGAKWLWQRIVQMSYSQKARAQQRTADRAKMKDDFAEATKANSTRSEKNTSTSNISNPKSFFRWKKR